MRLPLISPRPAKTYFVTTFLISCALLSIFTLVIYQQSTVSHDSSRSMVHSYKVLHQARNILIHSYDADIAERNYIATGTLAFVDSYDKTLHHLDEDSKSLANFVTDNPTQKSRADALRKDIMQFKKMAQAQIYLYRNGESTASGLAASTEAREKIVDDIHAQIQEFSRAELDLLDERTKIANQQQHNYVLTLFIGAILSVGALIIANLLIFGLVNRGSEVEKELQKSEERFRLLMHGINDGIFDRDLSAGTVYFSPACASMLGYTEEEFTPGIFEQLIHPDDWAAVEEARRRYADHETSLYAPLFRARHKDGSWRWIMTRGIGIWDESGKIQRLVGAMTD